MAALSQPSHGVRERPGAWWWGPQAGVKRASAFAGKTKSPPYKDSDTKNKCLKTGNAQYLLMGMAAIQFLKSFTPIVTACVTFVILSRKESSR